MHAIDCGLLLFKQCSGSKLSYLPFVKSSACWFSTRLFHFSSKRALYLELLELVSHRSVSRVHSVPITDSHGPTNVS